MRNKAKFRKSQMFITATVTMNCNEKCKMDTWSKRTQTKPILLSLVAGKIALSAVEGPVVSLSNLFFRTAGDCKMQNDFRIFRARTILIYGKIEVFIYCVRAIENSVVIFRHIFGSISWAV
jgi:hypothetical protein